MTLVKVIVSLYLPQYLMTQPIVLWLLRKHAGDAPLILVLNNTAN